MKPSVSERIKQHLELKKEKRSQQKRESYFKLKTTRKDTDVKRLPADAATRKRKQRQREIKVKEIRSQKNEMQRKWRANQKNIGRSPIRTHASVFTNKMQKSRALKKLKEALSPSTPVRVSTMSAYLSREKSPTIQGLRETGVIITPEDKENIELANAVINDIKSTLQQVKRKRSDDSRITMNILTASASGEAVEKSKFKTKLAKKFDVNKSRIFSAAKRNKIHHSEKAAFTYTERKTRADALTEEVRRVVYDFWCSPENSRPTGNKVDVKRVRLAPKVYSSHAIHILDKTQTEVFEDFCNKYPNIQISLRKFEKCKPYFVRPARVKDRTTCCCRYHVETRTLFKTCMSFRKTIPISEPETYPIYNSLSDAVNATLCQQDQNAMHRKECLERTCTACGVHLLNFHESELSNESTVPDVKWEKYEYIEIKTKLGAKKKLMLVQKQTKPGEMFTYFQKILKTYPEHQFRAVWQNEQLKSAIQNLPQNHCITVNDYSENYRCIDQTEVQSAYFQKTEASIHVTLIYRHALLEVDGISSTESDPHIIGEQLFVISPDITHDKHFTRVAETEVAQYLKSVNYECTVMHEFCDGCQCQYKSRHCLGDLTASVNDLGYTSLYRNFFETSHAKGPQDAAGGLIKHQADLAVTRGRARIQNARDLYQFGVKNLEQTKSNIFKRRIFRYFDIIPRNIVKDYQPISSNLKIHQVIATRDSDSLLIRNTSCYSCDDCLEGNVETCTNWGTIETSRREIIKKSINCEQMTDDVEEIEIDDISDYVKKGSIVAVMSESESEEFYLFKCSIKETLVCREVDAWGASFEEGTFVLKGLYFEKINEISYKLICRKRAIVPPQSLLYICTDAKFEQPMLSINDEEIQNIVECVELSKLGQ